jgi:hypothetical protein
MRQGKINDGWGKGVLQVTVKKKPPDNKEMANGTVPVRDERELRVHASI